MLELPDVTLLAADTANHALALRALARSMEGVRFARAVLLTDALPPGIEAPPGVDVVPAVRIASRDDYSRLVLKGLAQHVRSSHVLLVQWDGYVLHPDRWDDAFLDCDYLGARWFWHTDGMTVGNGGFSLRSRRLLEALADPRIAGDEPEDELIGRRFRPLLEREHGVRFGSEALADRFSFEVAHPRATTFGFHALYNFVHVMPQHELAALVPSFSDAIARSPQCLQLMRNARALGQWLAVAALASRILAADPAQAEAAAASAEAGRAAGRDPYAGTRRNDRCPCGSGKRYKECHGAAGAVGAASQARDAAQARDATQGGPREATAPPPAQPPAAAARARADAGLAAHRRGDLALAERAYREALAADPSQAVATHYLGVLAFQRGDAAAAQPLVSRSLALAPGEAEFHNNAGRVALALDRVDDAIDAHRRAIALAPRHAIAHNNLGLALVEANRHAEAVDAYRAALAIHPDFAEARWNLAIALLGSGRASEGWPAYDARLALDALTGGRSTPLAPRYAGEALDGRTLLLRCEQGFGDAMQFVRFAQDFAARGARVVLEALPPLASLLATAPGVTAVVPRGTPPPAADFELPLLSAPAVLVLGDDPGAVTRPIPYLRAARERVDRWRAFVEARPARLRVGLSWAGNARHGNDRRRSCPLARLAPLFGIEGLALYSLQHRDGEQEVAGVPEARALVECEARHDFDDKAALVDCLDLVISVDTANAHLAGALGRPLWLMLPYSADWRWGVGTTATPWYPQARLFRQARAGDWDGVVAALAEGLRQRLAGGR